MKRRNFLKLIAPAAPMVFVPSLIKVDWGVRKPNKDIFRIDDSDAIIKPIRNIVGVFDTEKGFVIPIKDPGLLGYKVSEGKLLNININQSIWVPNEIH